ncbi:Putative vesicle-associated membrane protein, partial [Monoraphidium neglectum]
MPLAYALVARASDGAVLAQHSFVAGNFESVAMECLQRMQHGYDDKFTVNCDGYTFNYLLHAGYVFAVAADEAYGRQVPFACAQRVCDAWMEKFASKGRSAGPYGMDKNFRRSRVRRAAGAAVGRWAVLPGRGPGVGRPAARSSGAPVLKREMEFCQSHPSEMGRVAAVQQKVDAVKGVM